MIVKNKCNCTHVNPRKKMEQNDLSTLIVWSGLSTLGLGISWLWPLSLPLSKFELQHTAFKTPVNAQYFLSEY